ncbi:MAG: hypothetical protein COC19_04895 [SAR86 cluster bacterium]|uniref:MAPEG family protein n=1 Tax=SAR86 cluster bacterium TaxID=2030880 RepID=A0A2A4MMG5_9GAMM|nr:MAG: hypothetical protein COC19_04895 [SAR86 cluster bacterium]
MHDNSILFPMIALAWWTLCILMLIPYRRLKAVRRKLLRASDFTLGESNNVDSYVALVNRNYMNLSEAPLIFYVTCGIFYVTELAGQTALMLAWCYVGLRIVHSLIHISYNNVHHRLLFFALSNFALIALLAILTLSIFKISAS